MEHYCVFNNLSMPCSEHKDSGISLRAWGGWRRVLLSRVGLCIIKFIEEATLFPFGTTFYSLMGKDAVTQRFVTVYFIAIFVKITLLIINKNKSACRSVCLG